MNIVEALDTTPKEVVHLDYESMKIATMHDTQMCVGITILRNQTSSSRDGVLHETRLT